VEINQQAPMVTRKEIFIQAPPDVVWRIHTGINAWSQWQPGIALARTEAPLRVGSMGPYCSGNRVVSR
jgi:hypothetical protein